MFEKYKDFVARPKLLALCETPRPASGPKVVEKLHFVNYSYVVNWRLVKLEFLMSRTWICRACWFASWLARIFVLWNDEMTTGPLKVESPFRGWEIAIVWRTHEQTNEEKWSVQNFGIWVFLHLAESAVAAVGSISAKLRVLWLQWEAFLKNWKCCGCSEKHFCKAESAVAAVESISEKLRVLWLQ